MARNIMRAFKLAEISAVDRPAQAHARMAIMKRAVDKGMYDVAEFARVIASIGYLLQNSDNEAVIEADGSPVPQKLRGWLTSGAKVFQAMAEEEIDELVNAAVRKSAEVIDKATDALAESLISILGDTGSAEKSTELLAETFKQFSDHLSTELGVGAEKGDNAMSTAIKKALGLPESASEDEIVKALAKRDEALTKATLDLELTKLSGDERKFYDALKSDAERDAFRKADGTVRKAQMDKAAELSPEVTKAMQENEDLKKRVAAMEDKEALAGFTKRAVELGLPEAEGVTLQKASCGDKEAIERLAGFIKIANGQRDAAQKLAGVFKELGSSQGDGGSDKAIDTLKAKAEELRKKESALTSEQAFAKVYADPANRELVKRERAENRPAA